MSDRGDSSAAWNRVTDGNGHTAFLLPGPTSLLRIPGEEHGYYSCWHTDQTPCDRPGHETVQLFHVEYRAECPACGGSFTSTRPLRVIEHIHGIREHVFDYPEGPPSV